MKPMKPAPPKTSWMRFTMCQPLVLAVALWAGAALAHDTWVMPNRFVLPAGEHVAAVVSSGDGLKPIVAPTRRALRTLQLVDVAGRSDAKHWQRLDRQAQAEFEAPAPGLACLVLGMDETEISLDADTVALYLQEIQAPGHIVQAWKQQRANGRPWVERYAKDGKTYLRSGQSQAGWPALQRLGHRLEIVPQTDPTRLMVGDSLGLLLQMDGQAQPGIALRVSAGDASLQVVRTDSQGRAQVRVTTGGQHLIATTVLKPPASATAAWTSRFATLGFAVAAR